MAQSSVKQVKLGFTLTELLVVVSILAILLIIALLTLSGKRDKVDDARAKSELNRLKIAFEDYYADNNCYPPAEYFDDVSDCGSSQLSPYLNTIPCDRRTNLPYILEKDDSGCSWFKLYTNLKTSESDPEALSLCDPSGSNLGNYAISSENVRPLVACPPDSQSPSPSTSSSPSSTPSPTPSQPSSPDTYYYCSTLHNCTTYNPLTHNCTPSYINNSNCDGGITPCQNVGSCTPK